MAVKVNAGEGVRRSDMFYVDPREVIVREELRGRHVAPDADAIISMAESMFDHGQRQAVECRRVEGSRLQLTLGFTRTAAARLIRTGFKGEDGVERQDPDFMLKVVITDANDERAFLNNIVENAHRNQTSDLDDAYNQARLRDRYGYNDTQIASLYRYKSPGRVQKLRRLLELPGEIQTQVHTGALSLNAAIELLDVAEEKRVEVLAQVQGEDGSGKATASRINEVVREEILRDDEQRQRELVLSNGPASGAIGKLKPLSMREVKEFLTDGTKLDGKDLRVSQLCSQFLEFVSGRMSKENLLDDLRVLLTAGE